MQQLLLDSFPEEEIPEEEKKDEEGEVLSLGRHLPDNQKREETEHIRSTFHS